MYLICMIICAYMCMCVHRYVYMCMCVFFKARFSRSNFSRRDFQGAIFFSRRDFQEAIFHGAIFQVAHAHIHPGAHAHRYIHTRTYAHTRTRTHARARTHTHTNTSTKKKGGKKERKKERRGQNSRFTTLHGQKKELYNNGYCCQQARHMNK